MVHTEIDNSSEQNENKASAPEIPLIIQSAIMRIDKSLDFDDSDSQFEPSFRQRRNMREERTDKKTRNKKR